MTFNKEIYFHIGYHKTGTTWMQKKFFQHHYDIISIGNSQCPWNDPFLGYLIGSSDRKFNNAQCVKLFKDQIPKKIDPDKKLLVSCERLSGHPFSGGYDCLRIAERIKECFPNSRIICVVRNQIDIIPSVYKQMVYEGYTGNIESFLFSNNWKGVSFSLEYYEYDILLSKYHSLFCADNVLAITYEEMKNNPENFLRLICKFLKIDFLYIEDADKPINISLSNSGLVVMRFLNYFRKSELNRTPILVIDNRFRKLSEKFFKLLPTKETIINDNLFQKIVQYYKPSNAKLKKCVVGDASKYL